MRSETWSCPAMQTAKDEEEGQEQRRARSGGVAVLGADHNHRDQREQAVFIFDGRQGPLELHRHGSDLEWMIITLKFQ